MAGFDVSESTAQSKQVSFSAGTLVGRTQTVIPALENDPVRSSMAIRKLTGLRVFNGDAVSWTFGAQVVTADGTYGLFKVELQTGETALMTERDDAVALEPDDYVQVYIVATTSSSFTTEPTVHTTWKDLR